MVYDTNIKLASLGSARLGLGSLRFILNIMASVERVVILLQGCIFDACGSYHNYITNTIKNFGENYVDISFEILKKKKDKEKYESGLPFCPSTLVA